MPALLLLGCIAGAVSALENTTKCVTGGKKAGLSYYACKHSIDFVGTKDYKVNVPAVCMTEGSSCGLVVDMHGGGMNADWQDKNTRMRALGEKHGYIVVQPNMWAAGDGHQDDALIFAFMNEIVDLYQADKKRLHFAGFSLGGSICWRMVQKYSDTFASFAPMGDCPIRQASDLPATRRPLLHMIGRKSVPVPYKSCVTTDKVIVETWGLNQVTVVKNETGYTRTVYRNAQGDILDSITHYYAVGLCGVEPGILVGHCFPGGGDTCDQKFVTRELIHLSCPGHPEKDPIDWRIGDEVMQFFIEHPLK